MQMKMKLPIKSGKILPPQKRKKKKNKNKIK